MPNYYTSFSHEITGITPEERSWLEAVLKDPDDMGEQEWKAWCDEHWDGPGHAPEHWPGFSYAFEQHDAAVRFWFYSDGCGNVDHAILLVEAFLSRFRPHQELTISWAHTCSRPIVSAYGGGSYTCNARASTEARWMREAIELLERVHYPSANEARDAAADTAIDAVRKAIGQCTETASLAVPAVTCQQPADRPFDEREAAAILAGLRVLQSQMSWRGELYVPTSLTEEVHDVLTNGGAIEALTSDEIDQLYQRLDRHSDTGARGESKE
jgi:hypothetical protein